MLLYTIMKDFYSRVVLYITIMKKITLLQLVSLFQCLSVFGQSDNLQWKLAGRFQLDGVGFISAPDTLSHQLDIVDIRLGGKVTLGDWYVNLDVAYSNDKVSLKDAFVQYSKHNNYFRAGHQYVFTGIDEPNSSNDMLFNAISNIASLLDNGRRIGVTYTRSVPHYYLTTGFFVGDNIHTRGGIKQGYSTVLRALWRPVNEETRLLHVGASGFYKNPNQVKGTNIKNIILSDRGGVRAKVPELHLLSIDNVKHQVQCVAEFYGNYGKWMATGEYHWTQINRVGTPAYKAHGGYIQGGYLIKGNHYGYDQVDAFPMLPTDKGSLLIVARYNQSKMNDNKAGLYAGNQKDLTLGLDYFLNKNISTRLNYSFVKLDEYSTVGKEDLHLVQCRMQFRF